MQYKSCRRCNIKKPTNAFRKRCTGGVGNMCIKCRNLKAKEYGKKKSDALKLWRTYYE